MRADGRNRTPDNPVYVQNMYAAFKANAAALEYESYFDTMATSRIWPTTRFPKAAAAYRALWSAGR